MVTIITVTQPLNVVANPCLPLVNMPRYKAHTNMVNITNAEVKNIGTMKKQEKELSMHVVNNS